MVHKVKLEWNDQGRLVNKLKHSRLNDGANCWLVCCGRPQRVECWMNVVIMPQILFGRKEEDCDGIEILSHFFKFLAPSEQYTSKSLHALLSPSLPLSLSPSPRIWRASRPCSPLPYNTGTLPSSFLPLLHSHLPTILPSLLPTSVHHHPSTSCFAPA